MRQFPFTDYDFWAYLTAGFFLIFGMDTGSSLGLLEVDSWPWPHIALLVALAYVLGHLLAGLSSMLLERWLVRRCLGGPLQWLMGTAPKPWISWLFPSYFESLPLRTIAAIQTQSQAANIQQSNGSLFWLAFQAARKSPDAVQRMDTFLNLYGFCRNISLVALIDAVIWGVEAYLRSDSSKWLWAAASLVIGLGLFFRYLKFYRHYTQEVLVTFAHQ